jgi:hypothetical protein
MLSFSISYPDLIKFPYFVDTTQRADRGAKAEEIGGYTEGDFMDTSSVQVIFSTHRILNSVIE